jgi:uncharacterized protein YodC (DUF2158 family)
METFKVGDTVWLKIGGPKMSIRSIDKFKIMCDWFEGKELQTAPFQPDQLTKQGPDTTQTQIMRG